MRRFIGAALVLLLTLPAVGAAQDAPAWLDQLARTSASRDLETNVDAVVLLDDLSVTVGENGRIVMRRQYAVKVLTRAGAAAAVAREIYTTDAQRREDWSRMEAVFDQILSSLPTLAYEPVVVPKASVAERAAFVLQRAV